MTLASIDVCFRENNGHWVMSALPPKADIHSKEPFSQHLPPSMHFLWDKLECDEPNGHPLCFDFRRIVRRVDAGSEALGRINSSGDACGAALLRSWYGRCRTAAHRAVFRHRCARNSCLTG